MVIRSEAVSRSERARPSGSARDWSHSGQSRNDTTGPSTQSPALSLPTTGTRASRVCSWQLFNEAHMDDYDPAPTSDEELEQAYQEKYG